MTRISSYISIIILAAICSGFINCSDSDSSNPPLTDTKAILGFSFKSIDNAGLTEDFDGTISGTNITVNIPNGSGVTALVPQITFTGASVSPGDGVSQNYTTPVDYTVTAEDGSTLTYTVTVNAVKYRTFITSSVFDGDLETAGNGANGIAGADALCMSDTNNPGGIFKALIVDGTNRTACTTANCSTGTSEHTDWVLRPGTNYYRSDGSMLIMTTNSNGIFVDWNMLNSFSDDGDWWTGLNSDWTTNVDHCGTDWDDSSSITNGGKGQSGTATVSSITSGISGCDQPANILCVEQ